MKSTLNVALLKKVKKHILEEPNRLIMGNWIERADPGTSIYDYEATFKMPKCGTVGCIAGWCCLLSDGMDYPITGNGCSDRAAELLGLPRIPAELFHAISWDNQDAYDDFEISTDPKERAQIVAEVIDDFIARHETSDQS